MLDWICERDEVALFLFAICCLFRLILFLFPFACLIYFDSEVTTYQERTRG